MVDNHELVATWQNKIIECCETRLGRRLWPVELKSIRRYGGFLALEMIQDTVSHGAPDEIVAYLSWLAAQ